MSILGVSVLGLVGGPGGLKSSLVRAIEKRWPEEVVVAHEAATILLGGGFPPPGELPTLEGVLPFQRAVYGTLCGLEELAALHAQTRGVRLIVTDRGRLGGAAYLPVDDQLAAFAQHLDINVPRAYAIYDRVVHLESLAVVDPDEYERLRKLDKTPRMEGAEQACIRDRDIRTIWRDHPQFKVIAADSSGPQPKFDAVFAIVEEMLRG